MSIGGDDIDLHIAAPVGLVLDLECGPPLVW